MIYTPSGTVYYFDEDSEDLVQVYVEPDVQQQPTNRHLHADLIIAWANGAKIEYFAHHENKWISTNYPEWSPSTKYRIKPEAVVRYYKIEQETGWHGINSDANAEVTFIDGKLQSIKQL